MNTTSNIVRLLLFLTIFFHYLLQVHRSLYTRLNFHHLAFYRVLLASGTLMVPFGSLLPPRRPMFGLRVAHPTLRSQALRGTSKATLASLQRHPSPAMDIYRRLLRQDSVLGASQQSPHFPCSQCPGCLRKPADITNPGSS